MRSRSTPEVIQHGQRVGGLLSDTQPPRPVLNSRRNPDGDR